MHPEPDAASPASTLLRDSLVWDHHACMPLRPHDDSFLPQLARHKRAGFDVVTLNVGFGDMGVEEHLRMLASLRRWLGARPEQYLLIDTADDIARARDTGRLGISFDIEGANAVGGDVGRVQRYYDLGVRWMLLAYNRNNQAGGGCQDDDAGLTDFGRKLITEMERVGMQVCLSHTGHRTAREVLAIASRPVIFSHSNCAAVYAHPRNLPDSLIRACAHTGGLIGINGVGSFLGRNDISSETFARHVDHAVQLVGPQHVSIALDYVYDMQELDAYIRTMQHTFPPGLGYELGARFVPPEQIAEIVETLLGWGYSEADLQAILGRNLERLARVVWKPPLHPS